MKQNNSNFIKTFLTIFSLLPLFCFSLQNSETTIEVIKKEFNPEIPNNKSKLKVFFFNPNGDTTTFRDIRILIDNDTICFNSNPNKLDSLLINSGKHTIQINSKWWKPSKKQIKFLSQHTIFLDIRFSPETHSLPTIEYDYDKPVIYAYPTKKQNIEIQLDFIGKISFTYPKHQESWKFIGNPNGNIEINENTYRYLFWEGELNSSAYNIDKKIGFIVHSDTLLNFFHKTLLQIGFNSFEQQDFITYWYPIMSKNKINYVSFIFNDEYNTIAKLKVEPKPDNFIRMFMFWEAVSTEQNYIPLKPQPIPSFSRDGFTIVEWGGTNINHNKIPK